MRKTKPIFLFVALAIFALLAACTRSASTGSPTPQGNDQLNNILTVVASQTPAGQITPVGTEGTGGGANPTNDLATDQPPTPAGPTATPKPKPTATPLALDLKVPESYTLRKGEFPYCIARRFNIDVNALLKASGLALGQNYPQGLKLTIPQNAAEFQGDPQLLKHPGEYTVKSGDTFYTIACKYGDVWPEEIAAANSMELTDRLTAGDKIAIP